MIYNSTLRLIIALTFSLTLSFLLGASPLFASSPAAPAESQDTFRQGERIYREAILPSGEPLRASFKGSPAVPGLTFACIGCHLRSGLGALDEGVRTPAINGSKLFRPLPATFKGNELNMDIVEPLRPAYTEESLIKAIRTGTSANGSILNEGMPRYSISDNDARILVAYLKALSSQFSPGVGKKDFRFATVISEDFRPKETAAMLAAIDYTFKMKNNLIRSTSDPRSMQMAENMVGRDAANRILSLSRWVLKGPPETWRRQLEEYNRTEPVFALLGGIVDGPWQPIHQFCEDNKIPSLFPNTDLPVISDTDWYTLYLSKGYYQEGESAARFLNSTPELLKARPIVQVVRTTPEGEALATGFKHTLKELGLPAPVTVTVPPGKVLDREFLLRILAKEKPAVLAVWDDATALPTLESVSRRDGRPEKVFLSGRYLGERIWTLPESMRADTFLTYPFAFAFPPARTSMGLLKVQDDRPQTLRQSATPLRDEVHKMSSLTSALTELLSNLMMEMRGSYYRDNFLDVAGMMPDQYYPLYGRISFGTGQRYAARGCFIVQLTPGANPELVKKSSWVIH
jgi:mono/diheme cytochrome c family protein